VSRLSKIADVPIRLRCHPDDAGAVKVGLRVTDMRFSSALKWLTNLAGLRYTLWGGAIEVHPPERLHHMVTLLVDVRDLEARGIRPDWQALICSNVRGAGYPYGFDDLNGILAMDFYANIEHGVRCEAADIAQYLAKLREALKLDPDRVRDLESPDRGGLF
jgi:hypothetical protein